MRYIKCSQYSSGHVTANSNNLYYSNAPKITICSTFNVEPKCMEFTIFLLHFKCGVGAR